MPPAPYRYWLYHFTFTVIRIAFFYYLILPTRHLPPVPDTHLFVLFAHCAFACHTYLILLPCDCHRHILCLILLLLHYHTLPLPALALPGTCLPCIILYPSLPCPYLLLLLLLLPDSGWLVVMLLLMYSDTWYYSVFLLFTMILPTVIEFPLPLHTCRVLLCVHWWGRGVMIVCDMTWFCWLPTILGICCWYLLYYYCLIVLSVSDDDAVMYSPFPIPL